MELIEKLKLSQGLVIFGGRPGMGLTRLTLKLANQIASHDKVLFVSYQEHETQLELLTSSLEPELAENLTINSSLQFFNYGVFELLTNQLKADKISTLVIDDLNNFIEPKSDADSYLKDIIISNFREIADKLNIQIILNLSLSQTVEHRGGDKKPLIRDFRGSRKIMNECDQIFSLYRPAYYGITQLEDGSSALDDIEIECLKNDSGELFDIRLNNKEARILPTY